MGCNLRDLATAEDINLAELKGKRVGIDAFLTAFQFLTTIRDRSPTGDGGPLRDSKGRTVAHLMGILTRTTTMLSLGIQPVFIFDGPSPELKADELAARRARRLEAEAAHKQALEDGDYQTAQNQYLRPQRLHVALQFPCVSEAKDQIQFLHS